MRVSMMDEKGPCVSPYNLKGGMLCPPVVIGACGPSVVEAGRRGRGEQGRRHLVPASRSHPEQLRLLPLVSTPIAATAAATAAASAYALEPTVHRLAARYTVETTVSPT